jgi:hypothetical protein
MLVWQIMHLKEGFGGKDVWHIAWAAAVFGKLSVEDVALLAGKNTDIPASSYPPVALQGIVEVSELFSL